MVVSGDRPSDDRGPVTDAELRLMKRLAEVIGRLRLDRSVEDVEELAAAIVVRCLESALREDVE